MSRLSSPVTAAGPQRIHTVFPALLYRTCLPMVLLMVANIYGTTIRFTHSQEKSPIKKSLSTKRRVAFHRFPERASLGNLHMRNRIVPRLANPAGIVLKSI